MISTRPAFVKASALAALLAAACASGVAAPLSSVPGVYKGDVAGADSVQHWTLHLYQNGRATRDMTFDMTRTAAGTRVYPARASGTWSATKTAVTIAFRTSLDVGAPNAKPFPARSTLTLVRGNCRLRESRPGVPARYLATLRKLRCAGGLTL